MCRPIPSGLGDDSGQLFAWPFADAAWGVKRASSVTLLPNWLPRFANTSSSIGLDGLLRAAPLPPLLCVPGALPTQVADKPQR